MDMNKAEREIWEVAQELVSTKRGKNEFVSVDYAKGAFDMACGMALSLGQTTPARIEQIKKMAKEKTY